MAGPPPVPPPKQDLVDDPPPQATFEPTPASTATSVPSPTPTPTSAHTLISTSVPATTLDTTGKLQLLIDISFSGKLAIVLVCNTRKKMSMTYEDSDNLSLSIKPGDYVKERKRDRFKQLACRRAKELNLHDAVLVQRSSSVPASPVWRSNDQLPHEPMLLLDLDRRRRTPLANSGTLTPLSSALDSACQSELGSMDEDVYTILAVLGTRVRAMIARPSHCPVRWIVTLILVSTLLAVFR